MQYDIGLEFTDFPGGRKRDAGDYSGEEFREDILVPLLENVENTEIELLLDHAVGYPVSFLEEAFGGLIRVHGYTKEVLLKRFKFITDKNNRRDRIIEYIETASKASM